MKIIVTGGAGFIGSNLVDLLIADGHQVLVVDNLSTGRQEYINARAEFKDIDIVDEKLPEIFKDFKPEAVYHLAAQKNVRVSLEDPLFDARINIMGSLNVIESTHQAGGNKLIFASSGGAIYDANQAMPLTENSKAKPLSPYGISKYTIDQYLEFYYHNYQLNYVSLRFANVYGPRQDPLGEAGVVAIFFDKLINEEQAKIFGSGKQTRDYVYVGDIVESLKATLNPSANGTYNIGTGKEVDVNELYQMQTNIADKAISAEHIQAIVGELMRNALNSDKAKQDLGWQPQIELVQGLKLTYEWFKSK